VYAFGYVVESTTHLYQYTPQFIAIHPEQTNPSTSVRTMMKAIAVVLALALCVAHVQAGALGDEQL
jgi:hypothetical protein